MARLNKKQIDIIVKHIKSKVTNVSIDEPRLKAILQFQTVGQPLTLENIKNILENYAKILKRKNHHFRQTLLTKTSNELFKKIPQLQQNLQTNQHQEEISPYINLLKIKLINLLNLYWKIKAGNDFTTKQQENLIKFLPNEIDTNNPKELKKLTIESFKKLITNSNFDKEQLQNFIKYLDEELPENTWKNLFIKTIAKFTVKKPEEMNITHFDFIKKLWDYKQGDYFTILLSEAKEANFDLNKLIKYLNLAITTPNKENFQRSLRKINNGQNANIKVICKYLQHLNDIFFDREIERTHTNEINIDNQVVATTEKHKIKAMRFHYAYYQIENIVNYGYDDFQQFSKETTKSFILCNIELIKHNIKQEKIEHHPIRVEQLSNDTQNSEEFEEEQRVILNSIETQRQEQLRRQQQQNQNEPNNNQIQEQQNQNNEINNSNNEQQRNINQQTLNRQTINQPNIYKYWKDYTNQEKNAFKAQVFRARQRRSTQSQANTPYSRKLFDLISKGPVSNTINKNDCKAIDKNGREIGNLQLLNEEQLANVNGIKVTFNLSANETTSIQYRIETDANNKQQHKCFIPKNIKGMELIVANAYEYIHANNLKKDVDISKLDKIRKPEYGGYSQLEICGAYLKLYGLQIMKTTPPIPLTSTQKINAKFHELIGRDNPNTTAPQLHP